LRVRSWRPRAENSWQERVPVSVGIGGFRSSKLGKPFQG
jgi:hypothetical protein